MAPKASRVPKTPTVPTQASRAFDRWAATYEQSPLQTFLFGHAHKAVLRCLGTMTPAATLVDVGCGTGRLLRRIASLWPGCALIGVDPSPQMIETARALSPGITFYVGGAEDVPVLSGEAAVVTSTISFHHWTDRERGVREAYRILRPEGHLVLVDLAGPPWLARILGDPPYGGIKERNEILGRVGFTGIHHESVVHPYLLRTSAEKGPYRGISRPAATGEDHR